MIWGPHTCGRHTTRAGREGAHHAPPGREGDVGGVRPRRVQDTTADPQHAAVIAEDVIATWGPWVSSV